VREEKCLKLAEAIGSTNDALLLDVSAGYNAAVMGFRRRRVIGVEKEDHGGALTATSQGDKLLEAYS